MTYKLYFTNGGEPSDDERHAITEAYNAWEAARAGEGRVDEHDAAYALIEELMVFASIQVEETDYQECDNCGDDVHTLSTRGWCDGCEEEAANLPDGRE